jgi:hypothetical protein
MVCCILTGQRICYPFSSTGLAHLTRYRQIFDLPMRNGIRSLIIDLQRTVGGTMYPGVLKSIGHAELETMDETKLHSNSKY